MWSDAPEPGWIARQCAAIRDLLDAGAHGARVRRHRLSWRGPAERCLDGLRLHGRPGTTWLDGGCRSRHLVAWDPLLTIAARGGRTVIAGAGARLEIDAPALHVMEALEAALRDLPLRLFGYLGYELAAELELLSPFAPADIDVPDLWLGVHDAWLEGDDGGWVLAATGRRWSAAQVEALAQTLSALPGDELPAPGARAAQAPSIEPDARGYTAAVARTVARIHAGEIFQTNLCRRFGASLRGASAWDLYRALRRQGDADHGAYLVADGGAVLSRSPECFLRVRGRTVESMPIKGTRARDPDPERDRALARELLASDKERAELAMIVDLVRNDLGRVCTAGTVEVAEHARLMELPAVWHTVSRVRGTLAPGVGPTRLLRATFPAGSITGAPKIQAIEVAGEQEPRRRGPAMGAVGWIDPAGDLELSVAIRTAVAAGDRVVYHAGCGIVAESDPAQELEESLVKARAFLAAIGS